MLLTDQIPTSDLRTARTERVQEETGGYAMARRSLMVVANRLPVDETVLPDGTTTWARSPGGLVSALHPVLRDRHGTWIGWSGAIDSAPFVPDLDNIRMRSVALSDDDYQSYYEGYANSTLWPLYHDAVETPAFHRRWWEAYQRVNRRFAQVTADYAERDSMIWVQDYHLQLVPALLRELRPDLRIGFFMHIPFPRPSCSCSCPAGPSCCGASSARTWSASRPRPARTTSPACPRACSGSRS